MQSLRASGYNITVRMTLWPIQHWLILICFDLLLHLKNTLLATNSSLFENISTSLIWTHSFMARLTLLLSIIERVGTESVKPSGTFSNPIAISFTIQFHVLMCRLTQFMLILASTLLSIVLLYWLTSSHRHKGNFIPHVSGFSIGKRPLVLLLPSIFFITPFGPLQGVTSGFSATQWRLSISHPTFLSGLMEAWFCLIFLLLRIAEIDSENLVNCFFSHFRDSVPSARWDWLSPDPLQLNRNFLVVHVVMGYPCSSLDKLTLPSSLHLRTCPSILKNITFCVA